MEKLSGDYIAGFVDGEGCFALKFRQDIKKNRTNSPVYYYWDIEFAIVLRSDDKDLLEKIMTTLGCGRISLTKNGESVRYAINNLDDLLNKIVLLFDKHKLQGKKKFDFELWKEALLILSRNRGKNALNKDNIKRLIEIHNSMKNFKSRGKEWKWIHKAISA